MKRRRLLQLGFGAGLVLAVAGGSIALLRPALVDGRLQPRARQVFRAVARAVLDGSLPGDLQERERALDAHLQRLERTIDALPAHAQGELSTLVALLGTAAGRLAVASLAADWPDATAAEIASALQGMRLSSLALRVQAYQALRDLTAAAYFADPSAWSLLGYPGPVPV